MQTESDRRARSERGGAATRPRRATLAMVSAAATLALVGTGIAIFQTASCVHDPPVQEPSPSPSSTPPPT
jgi:hypothetical protein